MVSSRSVALDYAVAGPLTELDTVSWTVSPDNPVAVCWPVHDLVIQPDQGRRQGLAEERFAENQIRPAARLLEILAGRREEGHEGRPVDAGRLIGLTTDPSGAVPRRLCRQQRDHRDGRSAGRPTAGCG